jgi:hypothetical protein
VRKDDSLEDCTLQLCIVQINSRSAVAVNLWINYIFAKNASGLSTGLLKLPRHVWSWWVIHMIGPIVCATSWIRNNLMKSLNSSDSLRHSNWVSTAKLFFFRAVMCSPQVNHPFSPFLWLKKAVFSPC